TELTAAGNLVQGQIGFSLKPNSVAHFRKIEIKELPPGEPHSYALHFDGQARVRVPSLKLGVSGPHTIEAYITRQGSGKEDPVHVAGFFNQSSLHVRRNGDKAQPAFDVKQKDGPFLAAPAPDGLT